MVEITWQVCESAPTQMMRHVDRGSWPMLRSLGETADALKLQVDEVWTANGYADKPHDRQHFNVDATLP